MPSVKILNSNNEWEYAASGSNGGGEAQVNLDRHIADEENPHKTTAEQLGIHVGAEEPVEGNIWFDTSDEPVESYYTKDEVDERFVNKSNGSMTGNLIFDAAGKGAIIAAEDGFSIEHDKDGKVACLKTFVDDMSAKFITYNGTNWVINPILHSGNFSTYAAPAGNGYDGKAIPKYYANSDEELFAALDELLATMPRGATKQIEFQSSSTWPSLAGYSYFGTLFKDSDTVAVLEGTTYGYQKDTSSARESMSVVASRLASGWGPFEYYNPPLLSGIEFRTTERVNYKAVFKRWNGTKSIIEYRLDGETEWKPYSNANGGMAAKVLWTNASSQSAFASQSISVPNLSDYNYMVVIARITEGGLNAMSSGIVPVIEGHEANIINVGGFWAHMRAFAPHPSSNTVAFGAGSQINLETDATYPDWNNRVIPWQIIGLKVV